ncbi:MAG: T9SS type A sorting domain-containing protein [FCB group bacterium]|nr:T9SS type A sorting domain-containing protein [FCB group bacterium]MBL7029069.1 T9SS type A sorting domain-containing protein [Candidatus Neomarinimicrobiota bacterium]MBL7122549.1 T9SS type A sorting domain-containing protein [Candidatus Neomarinimicrobiota bacterium]
MRIVLFSIIGLVFIQSILLAADDWALQSPSTKPAANHWHELAFVGGSHAVLFGGYYNSAYGTDTWVFNATNNSWTQKSPSTTPVGRKLHSMAYIGDDQGILFGGYVSGSRDSDTWIYDLSADSWTENTPNPAPSDRQDHAIAYIGNDQILLFGGYDGALDDETWMYDLSADSWTNKAPSSKPSGRQEHAMSYIGGDQVLLFGGYDGSNDNETWLYDLSDNIWTNKAPSSPPPIRVYHAMAYMGGDQALLFGGRNSSNYNDTWVYDLSANTWTQDANSGQPTARFDHALCETSMSGASYIVLFGGTVSTSNDETWTFGGGDYSLPVELSSFTARGEAGLIVLEWITESEIDNLGFSLERRTSSSDWIEIANYQTNDGLTGQGSVTGQSCYSFVDVDVKSEEIYDYRLADISYTGEKEYYTLMIVGIQVESNLPATIILSQNYPNPFNPTTIINYALPEQSRVKLTVFDIQGQEVLMLQDVEKPPGIFDVQWNGLDQGGNPVSTGVYFCRLDAGKYSQAIKMVYLR